MTHRKSWRPAGMSFSSRPSWSRRFARASAATFGLSGNEEDEIPLFAPANELEELFRRVARSASSPRTSSPRPSVFIQTNQSPSARAPVSTSSIRLREAEAPPGSRAP